MTDPVKGPLNKQRRQDLEEGGGRAEVDSGVLSVGHGESKRHHHSVFLSFYQNQLSRGVFFTSQTISR